MQLNPAPSKGRIVAALGALTANLLAANGAQAQQAPANDAPTLLNETASEPGSTTVDTAVLFYQEQGGRVRAIEPAISLTINRGNGDVITASTTYDTLTGATPNGAAPWTAAQTFTVPIQGPGSQSTTTSASGKKQIVTLPGGAVVGQYTTAANTLPVDPGFTDDRHGVELGYSHVLDTDTKVSMGISGSNERDYRSFSVNAGFSRELFNKNTTLSIGGNAEFDFARPKYGIPMPLTVMNGIAKGPSQSKTVTSVVVGVTQVLTRNWLVQANYDYGSGQGYQTDPYKIVSVVSATTGAPLQYLYESRPRSRIRQSVYVATKLSIGSAVTDVSLRYYHDSWKIGSVTAEASETIPIGRRLYVEPGFRYYRQSAASFFAYYLPGNAPLPQYASADSRLSRFSANTFSLKAGVKVFGNGELYVLGEDYRQTGAKFLPNAPGALATENVFAGVHAISLVTGLRFTFR
jgi:hypothetical protein